MKSSKKSMRLFDTQRPTSYWLA